MDLGPVDPESILIHRVLPLPELTEAQATLIRLFHLVVGVSGLPVVIPRKVLSPKFSSFDFTSSQTFQHLVLFQASKLRVLI